MRFLTAAALVFASAVPAFADEVKGTILAYDRVANVIVLDDKTVWNLDTLGDTPLELLAGDIVLIVFTTAGDNGVAKIVAVEKAAN